MRLVLAHFVTTPIFNPHLHSTHVNRHVRTERQYLVKKLILRERDLEESSNALNGGNQAKPSSSEPYTDSKSQGAGIT